MSKKIIRFCPNCRELMEIRYRNRCKKCALFFKKLLESGYKKKYRDKPGVREAESIKYKLWYKKNALLISKKKHLYYQQKKLKLFA